MTFTTVCESPILVLILVTAIKQILRILISISIFMIYKLINYISVFFGEARDSSLDPHNARSLGS